MEKRIEQFTPKWILENAPKLVEQWNADYRFDKRLAEILQYPRMPDPSGVIFSAERMIRAENVPMILEFAREKEAYQRAFLLLCASGLYEDARSLIEYLELSPHEMAKFDRGARFGELGIWGRTPVMLELFRHVDQLCRGICAYPTILPNILISGESGTGKEGIARAIHKLCGRVERKLSTINCASQNSELFRSELFGHVKGAFTGAVGESEGALHHCNRGGTVFLDEINSLSRDNQGHLLRVLQEKEYCRVGEQEKIRKLTNVLFIAATNQDLSERQQKGDFREDLYYRLIEHIIRVPTLRKRSDDIPLLINKILLKYGETVIDNGRVGLASGCFADLKMAEGNVRWLEGTVELWVRLSAPSCTGKSLIRQALDAAVEDALKEGETLPLTKAELARKVKWRGKCGLDPSNLHKNLWKGEVQNMIREKIIKPGRSVQKD